MKRELKVGAFLGLTLLIMAVFIIIVGDIGKLFKEKGYPLYIQFNSAAGLDKGAVVRMAGVKIGYVEEIELKGIQAEVRLDIDHGIQIRKGSKATLAALGLLGEKYVEIIPSDRTEICQPGDVLEGIPAVSFDQLGTLLFSIGTEVQDVGESLRGMIGEEEDRAHFRNTLKNLSGFSEELRDFFAENREMMDTGLSRSNRAIQNFNEKIDALSKNLEKLISSMNGMIDENRQSVKANLESVEELISKTEESLRMLNKILGKVNKGEGSLGRLIQSPDLYDKTEETVDKIGRVADPVSEVSFFTGFRVDYLGRSNMLKGYLNLGFWWANKNYLMAQLVHDPWQDKFNYSLLIGYKWKNLSPRIGVMESKIGLGVDFYAVRDRLIFSFEGFDLNRDPRPQFRFFTRFTATPFLYFLLGINDFTLAPNREIFLGVGLDIR